MSSLKDLASLIMIPSLYKDGELHTVKPLADENIIVHPDATDNNDGVDGTTTPSTSSNFTFSRGSNLAATRVDVNGLIEKGRENLLTYSNAFSNAAWTKVNASVASGQADKDGGTDAWKISSSASGSSQIFMSGSNTNMKTHSIYAKAGSVSVLKIWVGSNKEFDLSNGTTSSTNSKITDVGNGWYRCEVFDVFSNYNPFFTATAAGDFVYIQDAQLEQGLVATDYIETGASTAQAGILEDMPRLDYSGSCPSLLLEPQRSNLFNYSEYFGSTSWIKSNSSVTTNTAVSPSGNTDANLITSSGSEGQVYQTKTLNGSHTFSAFFKAGTSVLARLQFYDSGAGTSAIGLYNLTTLSVSTTGLSSTGTITDYGNGWYRCTLTASLSGSAVLCFLGLNENAKNISAWGAQVEAGSYPTSYIPTYGTSQTRSADFSNNNDILGTAYSSNNFSYFIEFKLLQNSGTSNSPMLFGGGSLGLGASGKCYLRIGLLGNNTLSLYGHGDTLMASVVYAFTKDTNYKLLVKRSGTDVSFFVNGVQTGSTQTSSLDFTLRSVGWSYNAGTYNTYGDVKQFVGFDTALTDSECIALTTL